MEYYDTFDENGVFMTSEDDYDVHYKGLWHKVIRIWLYDNEGNLYLRIRKDSNKLDAINELHELSSESVSSCFDRGMFEKLGIHFPATSHLEQAYMKKISIHKVYSDNSELKDNFFLCNMVGEFDPTSNFFIYSDDTAGLMQVNAKGIIKILKSRTGEIVGYPVLQNGVDLKSKKLIKIEDIYETSDEDTFDKFNVVVETISKISRNYQKNLAEQEKLNRLAKKVADKSDDEITSHADDNEGADIY